LTAFVQPNNPRYPSGPAKSSRTPSGALVASEADVHLVKPEVLGTVMGIERYGAASVLARIANAAFRGTPATLHAAALAVGLLCVPPVSKAIDTIANAVALFVPADMGNLISVARAQTAARPKSPADALDAYNKAVNGFKSILSQRRAQISSNQLPNLPGQALYVARNNMISAYRDLTDAIPSRIGRSNRYGIPPAYFDADNEPLLDEYARLFGIMQAPPAHAQSSDTPFNDVIELGTVIARARGLDAASAEAAGRISLGLFFAETNGNQNLGNARSNKYRGSLQSGVSEDRNGQKKWAAIKKRIAALDPALSARDAKEEARVNSSDQRFNHWTAVRNALMNAHADVFPQIPAIVKILPDPIDQMKLFELIQIIPSPTRAALRSGKLASHEISEPRIMGFLRNNSVFTFGHADRARTSGTFREILDAMWLFNDKFERALSKFNEIKAQQKR
jgi:hypothetical protein